jgi:hypothetical protein
VLDLAVFTRLLPDRRRAPAVIVGLVVLVPVLVVPVLVVLVPVVPVPVAVMPVLVVTVLLPVFVVVFVVLAVACPKGVGVVDPGCHREPLGSGQVARSRGLRSS